MSLSLLIDNECSHDNSLIKRKILPTLFFNLIEDQVFNTEKNIILNVNVKLIKSHSNYYKCDRLLKNIIIFNDKDLRNVLLNKQPEGYNPVIISNKKIFNIYTHFTIVKYNDDEYYIILFKEIENPLITYCDYYDGINSNVVVNNNFGSFILTSGNPIYDKNVIISSQCVFTHRFLKSLLNSTIYIVLLSNNDTDLLLTDSNTNIVLKNNLFNIQSENGLYETPPYNVYNTGVINSNINIFACVVDSTEIKVYNINNNDYSYNYEYVTPKVGNYYFYNNGSSIVLTCSECILYVLNIYSEIHNPGRIKYEFQILNKFL